MGCPSCSVPMDESRLASRLHFLSFLKLHISFSAAPLAQQGENSTQHFVNKNTNGCSLKPGSCLVFFSYVSFRGASENNFYQQSLSLTARCTSLLGPDICLSFCVLFIRMLSGLSEWFWQEWLWFPKGLGWADLEDRDGRVYAKAHDLWVALPIALLFLIVRQLFERSVQLT